MCCRWTRRVIGGEEGRQRLAAGGGQLSARVVKEFGHDFNWDSVKSEGGNVDAETHGTLSSLAGGELELKAQPWRPGGQGQLSLQVRM